MNDLLATLEGAEHATWSMWAAAARQNCQQGRIAALATVRRDGGAAVRSIVLRHADMKTKKLVFWTNTSSEKVSEIEENSLGEVLFWLSESETQIRAKVELSVRSGTSEAWEGLGIQSRKNYALVPLPGTPIADPNEAFRETDISKFSEITAHVVALDVVSLHATPQRRLIIDGSGARWVAP